MPTKINEISLLGLSTSPSDYEVQDGHLSAALNVLHNDGSVISSSSSAPLVMHNFGKDTVLFQHKNQEYNHLICRSGEDGSYYWVSLTDGKVNTETGYTGNFTKENLDPETDYKISAVGNSLVFHSTGSVFYCLWTEWKYKELGDHLPEVYLSFGLIQHSRINRNTKDYEKGFLSFYDIDFFTTAELEDEATLDKSFSNRKSITDSVMARIAEYINDETKKGRFVHPFIIRYAYRLYDNTLTMHSCPVLMVTNTGCSPVAAVDYIYWFETRDKPQKFKYYLEAQSYSLDYQAKVSQNLSNWSDIIKSVDIFVSNPFYPYEQDGEIKGFRINGDDVIQIYGETYMDDINYEFAYLKQKKNYTVSKSYFDEDTMKDSSQYDIYKKKSIYDTSHFNVDARRILWNGNRFYTPTEEGTALLPPPCIEFALPLKSKEYISNEIRECSTFYFVKSIPIDKLQTEEREEIDLEGALNNLSTKEAMTGEYYSHENIIPKETKEYNNRINYSGVFRELKYAPSIKYMVTYQDPIDPYWAYPDTNIKIVENGKSIVLTSESEKTPTIENYYIPYICYPNPSAKMLQVCYSKYTDKRSSNITLKEHNGLNASVAFEGFESIQEDIIGSSVSPQLLPTDDNVVYELNTIYTSDVDNPWSFRSENVESISANLIAMVPAVQALSQGQFGEYPMYAFSEDGVWALYPNNTGGWASKQPISRDVALSADAILQLNQSVIFATARGLMEISGSQVTCISEIFDGTSDMFVDLYKEHVQALLTKHTDIFTAGKKEPGIISYTIPTVTLSYRGGGTSVIPSSGGQLSPTLKYKYNAVYEDGTVKECTTGANVEYMISDTSSLFSIDGNTGIVTAKENTSTERKSATVFVVVSIGDMTSTANTPVYIEKSE